MNYLKLNSLISHLYSSIDIYHLYEFKACSYQSIFTYKCLKAYCYLEYYLISKHPIIIKTNLRSKIMRVFHRNSFGGQLHALQ